MTSRSRSHSSKDRKSRKKDKKSEENMTTFIGNEDPASISAQLPSKPSSPVPRAPPPPLPRNQSLCVDAPAFTGASMINLAMNSKSPMLPPWLPGGHSIDLHTEVKLFAEYITPTKMEHKRRSEVIVRTTRVVQQLWPNAKVTPYGSFVTNSYLPSSDIDLAVQGVGIRGGPNPICTLGAHFKSKAEYSYVQIIANTKVPIIKMVDSATGHLIDLSINVSTGPENTKMMQQYFKEHRALLPILLVIKYFLAQQQLNEVYRGGIGSYVLSLLIVAYIKFRKNGIVNGQGMMRPDVSSEDVEEDLGKLLLGFLNFFGTQFAYYNVGISLNKGGCIFSKDLKGWHHPSNPFSLSLEDPLNPENDLGKNMFAMVLVRSAFEYAHNMLKSWSSIYSPSPLSCVIFPDANLLQRRQLVHFCRNAGGEDDELCSEGDGEPASEDEVQESKESSFSDKKESFSVVMNRLEAENKKKREQQQRKQQQQQEGVKKGSGKKKKKEATAPTTTTTTTMTPTSTTTTTPPTTIAATATVC